MFFSSTAYEAFYTYIGIYLHEASIKLITSHEVLIGMLLLILGWSFLSSVWKYSSRYLPGFLAFGPKGGMDGIFKVIACFIVGVSILKVDAPVKVKNYKRMSWHTNPYINTHFPAIEESYKVSFVFDILTRSSEEFARLLGYLVDGLFKNTNSELEAPSAFYRAVIYSGSLTIDDSDLRDKIDVYTNRCLVKILSKLKKPNQRNKIDELYKENGALDTELSLMSLELKDWQVVTCLDLKEEVRQHLWSYAEEKGKPLVKNYEGKYGFYNREITAVEEKNKMASAMLVHHYLSITEDAQGLQHGAKVKGLLSNFFMKVGRFFSSEGWLNMLGQKDQVGAMLTAKRAEEFSDFLHRAPHIKGMAKMFLAAIFPWLIFFVCAGRWKVLTSWFVLYCSVLLWTPIWVLLYHLMTSIALSVETLEHFGRFSDGISLYSSSLITAKLYQFYALYSWLQILVGPLPTLALAWGMLSSFFSDSEPDSAPESVGMATSYGVSYATGGVSSAMKPPSVPKKRAQES